MAFRRKSHVAWRKFDEETVLVDLKQRRLFGLNASATVLWHALDGRHSAAELLAKLSPGSALPAATLDSFVQRLLQEGLVEEGPAGAESPTVPPVEVRALGMPPEIAWTEDVRNFGISCAFHPGQTAACDAAPTT